MSAPRPRGFCDVCGLPVRLRQDGTVGAHNDTVFSGGTFAEVRVIRCHGEGRPPRKRCDLVVER